jgi:hypothetical protein
MDPVSRTKRGPSAVSKRRTTLTLPAEALNQAQRIAAKRDVNLSTVVGEVLSSGLRLQLAAERGEAILQSYKQAFSGFSDGELAILDGVILESPPQG